jgi:hypothetical protein
MFRVGHDRQQCTRLPVKSGLAAVMPISCCLTPPTQKPSRTTLATIKRGAAPAIGRRQTIRGVLNRKRRGSLFTAPVGRNGVQQLLEIVADASNERVPEVGRAFLAALGAQLWMLSVQ